MSDIPTICPCETFDHPRVIVNPPGRNVIAYRVGDYTAFRHALLLSLPAEEELLHWRPSAKGDLGLQLLEWWAYLSDILTFYNERIANQAYLRTADLPESVRQLIRILGYRPRPGIGATGFVSALINTPAPLTLQQGFQIESKPGPGKQPQSFELETTTQINPPDAIAADPRPDPSLVQLDSAKNPTVLLKDAVTTVKVGDELLLMEDGWARQSDHYYALIKVKDVHQEKDPRGKTNTRVTFSFSGSHTLPGDAQAENYHLMKSFQFAHVWPYPTKPGVVIRNKDKDHDQVDLESITRQIKVGAPVLFEIPNGIPTPQLVSVTGYSELIWYANGDPSDPTQFPPPPPPPPPSPLPPPIPIPHTHIEFKPTLIGDWDSNKSAVVVRYSWQDVGQLTEFPSTIVSSTAITLVAVPPAIFPPVSNLPILLEDANGKGVAAKGTASGNSPTMQLTEISKASLPLTPPLRVLFNLLPVSRGKSVFREILGNGDATIAGQEFVLQKSPLTYLLSGDSTLGGNYKSTLRVWVNGVEWKEVPSFYGQEANAYVFVTREDENNKTHVQFGDGINGARLPSGVNNIVATYRYGSGADAPNAGTLNVILQPQPNLKAIRNPVPVGAGADPDPPPQIRRYAPRSVLTFGRAVSGDDYETIAAQAPGVARARSYWAFDPNQQRALVTVYIGDDDSAVHAASLALAGAADPNRPVKVLPAAALPIRLSFTLLVDPAYFAPDVVTASTAALVDADTGLFGAHAIRIGQSVYQSQIDATCLSVPGTRALHNLHFSIDRGAGFKEETGFRYDPGEEGFFQLQSDNLIISPEVADNAR
jgi:hypothetical protein